VQRPFRIRLARQVAVSCVCVVVLAGAPARAQQEESARASQLPTLKQLTLEELLEVDVTLPLRRPIRVMDAAAAVSVVTGEDIWRSGAASLPEALRTAPGVFVGRFSASSWVISTRGFATTASNKLLVLLDGRSVYSPLFSGVFWEQIDAPLFDVDRIEVVRGPGASLWGSNAMNGVVSVVSKRARDTQGTIVSVGTGAEETFFSSVRHGGRAGTGHYRIFGKLTVRDDAQLVGGAPAQDGQRAGHMGARVDFGSATNGFTLQGDGFVARGDLAERDDLESSGANILGRWTRASSGLGSLQLQLYYDRATRLVPLQFEEDRDTFDVDLQHRLTRSRHNISWGGGYRTSADDTTPTVLLFFDPEDRRTTLLSAFVQDEIALGSRVALTAGVRLEHNDYTGLETQPTVRARWTPRTGHNVWGAVSRAVRLPTRLDTDVRITQNGRVVISGNPSFGSETLLAYETGYRVTPASQLSADFSVFRNRYDDLRTQELPRSPGAPLTVGNGLNITTTGFEASGTLQPRVWMRFTSSYAFLTRDLTLDPDSRDPTGGLNEAVDPRHQWSLYTRFDLPHRIELDGNIRAISSLPNPGTPAYAEATIRLAWRPLPQLDLSIVGRDLLHHAHLEFVSPTSSRRTELERAVYTRITVAF
jgi:iron complex outermembrane receptor protein